jgi:hypothetical protein
LKFYLINKEICTSQGLEKPLLRTLTQWMVSL